MGILLRRCIVSFAALSRYVPILACKFIYIKYRKLERSDRSPHALELAAGLRTGRVSTDHASLATLEESAERGD